MIEQKLMRATKMSMGKVPEYQLRPRALQAIDLTLVQPIPSFNPLCPLERAKQGGQDRSGPVYQLGHVAKSSSLPVLESIQRDCLWTVIGPQTDQSSVYRLRDQDPYAGENDHDQHGQDEGDEEFKHCNRVVQVAVAG